MQVKIFKHVNYLYLEEEINEFIKDKTIIDIKFQANEYAYCAMIMYIPNYNPNKNSPYETITTTTLL